MISIDYQFTFRSLGMSREQPRFFNSFLITIDLLLYKFPHLSQMNLSNLQFSLKLINFCIFHFFLHLIDFFIFGFYNLLQILYLSLQVIHEIGTELHLVTLSTINVRCSHRILIKPFYHLVSLSKFVLEKLPLIFKY